jgi:hypothetical protein
MALMGIGFICKLILVQIVNSKSKVNNTDYSWWFMLFFYVITNIKLDVKITI